MSLRIIRSRQNGYVSIDAYGPNHVSSPSASTSDSAIWSSLTWDRGLTTIRNCQNKVSRVLIINASFRSGETNLAALPKVYSAGNGAHVSNDKVAVSTGSSAHDCNESQSSRLELGWQRLDLTMERSNPPLPGRLLGARTTPQASCNPRPSPP